MEKAETLTATTDSVLGKAQSYMQKVVTDDKAAVIASLREQGITTKAIAETLGLSTHTIYRTDAYLRRNNKIALISPKRIKKATAAVDAFMQGQPVGDVSPKCSTVLAAANVVLDRAYPKQSEEKPAGISFTQVNITLTASKGMNEVDVTPPVST